MDKCTYCEDTLGPFECDHVYPKWRGGTDKESNLVTACRRCNQLKRGMRVDLFLDNLRQVREGRLRVVTGRRGPKFQRVRVVKEKSPPRVGMTKREALWELNRRKERKSEVPTGNHDDHSSSAWPSESNE